MSVLSPLMDPVIDQQRQIRHIYQLEVISDLLLREALAGAESAGGKVEYLALRESNTSPGASVCTSQSS